MKKWALLLVSAVVLSACATDDNAPTTQSSSTQYESADAQNAQKYPHSGACRLLRENTAKKGRKILAMGKGYRI